MVLFVIFQPRINTGSFQSQYCQVRDRFFLKLGFKGTAMQIEKALINDCLSVWKVA